MNRDGSTRTRSAGLKAALLALAATILATAACEQMKLQKPRAFGREKEILVICDNDVWEDIEQPLRQRVEAPFPAVRLETVFEIAQVEASAVQHYKEWDKIILIEALEDKKLLPSVVDEETMDKLESGQGLFFSQKDIWARGQRVVGLAAPKEEELPRLVRLHGRRIYNEFLDLLREQELERMYLSGVNVALVDSLHECCGFSIVLPEVYAQIMEDSLPPNEMLFVHQEPVRSIFITWTESPGPLEYTQEALAAYRERMTGHIYPHQATLEGRIDTSLVTANGIERLRVYGVWENREQISGGVFVSQVIDVPQQNRRYYIDGMLFSPNPRKNKYRFVFQLDQIMDSFALRSRGEVDSLIRQLRMK